MAEFLTTAGTVSQLEQIATHAKERLVLVSPYLKISTIFMDRLRDVERRGLEIEMVYRKGELRADQRELLMQLHNLHLYSLNNLHAKCYMNESTAIVTSMNMYEFSEKKNREMGIKLDSTEPAYLGVKAEVDSIIAASERERVPGPAFAPAGHTGRKTGHCIRCLVEISRNPARPLCRSCYETWALFGNPDYPEKGCHQCGRAGNVSLARPLCRTCYR